ncbi:MAG: nuclear transport factor 2 family protein [Vicinamibacterales bacterium]
MPHLPRSLLSAVAALAAVVPAFAQGPGGSDRETLLALNLDYVRSVQAGDVQRFRAILADDFRASMPDGTLLDKAAFLAQTARPVTITGLACHDVELRILGDVAIVHARTTYTTADGRPATGRYTDVWARRQGTWLAVAAHVTRTP